MNDHCDICRVFEISKFDLARLTCICFPLFFRLVKHLFPRYIKLGSKSSDPVKQLLGEGKGSLLKLELLPVNYLKFRILLAIYVQRKCGLSGLESTKCLSPKQIGKTLIRLLLKKQSDLGLHCLSSPFWLAFVFQSLEHLQ